MTALLPAARQLLVAIAVVAAVGLGQARVAHAEWLQPDASYREAQFILRMAARDTAGHASDPGRLDSLGTALLRLGRLADASAVFQRSLALAPGDDAAEAALGKIALFEDRLGAAESLLASVNEDPLAIRDLFAAQIRSGNYAGAAGLAEEAGEPGRMPLLEAMAQHPIYQVTAGPPEATIFWVRAHPVPLVRVKLNGQSVLMGIDTGSADLLIDASAARRAHVGVVQGQRLEFWTGTRIAVKNAMVQRLEIGGFKLENLPAGTLSLRKWALEVNPRSEAVVGIIGLNFLRRFTPTFDYERQRLTLRRPEVAYTPAVGAPTVPFQIWGLAELTVYGSIAGGRTMAFVVQSGVPGCGIGAPIEVFEEAGVKPGRLSRLVKGAGTWLQGRPWAAVVVPAVSVGPVIRDKVAGWSGALDSSELWRHGVRRDALISNDFFRGRVTFDWARHRIVFEE